MVMVMGMVMVMVMMMMMMMANITSHSSIATTVSPGSSSLCFRSESFSVQLTIHTGLMTGN